MAATIFEKWNSRRISASVESPTAEFLYFIFGTTDEGEARDVVEGVFAQFYTFTTGGFQLIFQNYELTYLGNGNWDVSVHYGAREPRGSGQLPYPQETNVYAFEVGQQQVHRTQSIKTISSFGVAAGPVAAAAPNCQQAIGVNGDSVEGVDVDVPTFQFSETWYFPKVQIDLAYIQDIFNVAVAPVNDAPFRGFDVGEVRFLGATGSERDDQNFELTFRFAVSPNATGLTVNLSPPGGGAPLAQKYDKNGWEYVWFRYGDFIDTVNLVKQPTAVYVEQVYDSSSFDDLGIGN